MPSVRIIIAAAFIAMAGAGSAQAATDAGCWTVQNVAYGDVLNMRAQPDHRSSIVDRLNPNGHGIISANGVCLPRSKPWGQRWCPVVHYSGDRTSYGWAKARYLAGAGCP